MEGKEGIKIFIAYNQASFFVQFFWNQLRKQWLLKS